MRTKTSTKYYIKDMLGSFKIYYLVVALVVLAVLIINGATDYLESASVNGMEAATIIFLFVCGLNTFKPQFKFLSQNSVSRKNVVTAFMISCSITMGMALIDSLLGVFLTAVLPNYISMFSMVFGKLYSNYSFIYYLTQFIYLSIMYMTILMLGHFIASLYYRMNTVTKVIVSVGAFIFSNVCGFFMYIDSVEDFVFWFITICGYNPNSPNPWSSSLMYAISFCILGYLSYLCIRRIKIRE